MKPATAIALALLAVIILGGLFYLYAEKSGGILGIGMHASTTPASQSVNGGTAAGGDVSGLGLGGNAVVSVNSRSVTTPAGLTFGIPPQYGLSVAGQPIPASANAVIPPCDQGYTYCLYRISPPVANSNYESAGLAITERTDLTSQHACLTAEPAGYTGLDSTTSTAHTGYATSVFSPVSGAAAGSSETGAIYRLWYNTTCYQFETRVAKSQYANYPAGTKTEYTAAMQATTMAELQNLLAGMTLPNGTRVQFPAS